MSASPSHVSGSRYDGIWATTTLTKEDMAAALERNGLDVAVLDEWRDDWDQIDNWIFEFAVGDGQWWQDELADGVIVSGWIGQLTELDEDTVELTDDLCSITYDVDLAANSLTVDVGDSNCPADDVALQTAMVEAAPFVQVQAPGWEPQRPAPTPAPSGPLAPLTPQPATGSAERQLARATGTVQGAPLGYLEYLPPSYSEGGAPSPLLVFLHGSGESGSGTETALEFTLARAAIPAVIAQDRWPSDRPFVVLSPQHDEIPPSFCMEADEIHDFLTFALDHYNVDSSRVYVTGLSCGATGLWNYLARYRDELIAAAVPIAGFGLPAIDELGCELGRVPIWAFHGENDDRVPVHGAVYPLTKLQQCTDPAPVDAQLTVVPLGGHDVWTRVYNAAGENIYDWLLTHQR